MLVLFIGLAIVLLDQFTKQDTRHLRLRRIPSRH